MNPRGRWNLILNTVVAISFVLTALSGVYFLFVPGGRGAADAMVLFSRYTWDLIYNLLQGSQSYLWAFASNLSNQTGEVYQPQYLPVEQYQTIVGTQSGNGNARTMGSARGGGGYRGGQP